MIKRKRTISTPSTHIQWYRDCANAKCLKKNPLFHLKIESLNCLSWFFGPVRNDDSQLSGCFDVYFENYCCWLSSLLVLLLPSFAYSHYVCWCIWYSVYTHHERKTSSKVENSVFLLNWLPKHTITTLTHTARISYARVHKHNHIHAYTLIHSHRTYANGIWQPKYKRAG